MNAKTRIVLWAAFWLFSLLTLLVDLAPWMMEWRSTVRLTLGIISLVCGLSILVTTERTRRSVSLVIVGLIVGQWWLIKMLVVFTIWSVNGFAP
jgi:hypothetical protein